MLRDVSLTVPQGQRVAVLGRSGAGKSTLAALVRGDLRPSAGSVTLGGAPTAGFGDEAARWVGVIQQSTYLFNMTLRDNLLLAREDARDEELWDALDAVGLRPLAERLPQGLDTMVDEAGLRFSGGERHRVALARVLLRDAPVVVLDEPTVGLDPLTERALLDTLLEALAGRTVVMITPPPSRRVGHGPRRLRGGRPHRARWRAGGACAHERALPPPARLRPRRGGVARRDARLQG